MVRALSLVLALLLSVQLARGEEPSTSPPAPAAAPDAEIAQAAPAVTPADPASILKPPTPPPPARPRPIYTWGAVGTSFAYGQTYGTVGMGAGYLLRHGLAPNFEVSYNFGSTPTFWTIRPGVTWFPPMLMGQPYLGVYYSHWFLGNGNPDEDAVGFRAGLSLGWNLALAVTYDHALGCAQNCELWTPQLSLGFSI